MIIVCGKEKAHDSTLVDCASARDDVTLAWETWAGPTPDTGLDDSVCLRKIIPSQSCLS